MPIADVSVPDITVNENDNSTDLCVSLLSVSNGASVADMDVRVLVEIVGATGTYVAK